ncbi:MAG: hypothetical protein KIS78_16130 [Labilithrix sp.]|nr:hypothetical protein [Labilithrix sp.]
MDLAADRGEADDRVTRDDVEDIRDELDAARRTGRTRAARVREASRRSRCSSYLELAPKYWLATRARLDAAELERPIGSVTVPASLAAEEQASPS